MHLIQNVRRPKGLVLPLPLSLPVRGARRVAAVIVAAAALPALVAYGRVIAPPRAKAAAPKAAQRAPIVVQGRAIQPGYARVLPPPRRTARPVQRPSTMAQKAALQPGYARVLQLPFKKTARPAQRAPISVPIVTVQRGYASVLPLPPRKAGRARQRAPIVVQIAVVQRGGARVMPLPPRTVRPPRRPIVISVPQSTPRAWQAVGRPLRRTVRPVGPVLASWPARPPSGSAFMWRLPAMVFHSTGRSPVRLAVIGRPVEHLRGSSFITGLPIHVVIQFALSEGRRIAGAFLGQRSPEQPGGGRLSEQPDAGRLPRPASGARLPETPKDRRLPDR